MAHIHTHPLGAYTRPLLPAYTRPLLPAYTHPLPRVRKPDILTPHFGVWFFGGLWAPTAQILDLRDGQKGTKMHARVFRTAGKSEYALYYSVALVSRPEAFLTDRADK